MWMDLIISQPSCVTELEQLIVSWTAEPLKYLIWTPWTVSQGFQQGFPVPKIKLQQHLPCVLEQNRLESVIPNSFWGRTVKTCNKKDILIILITEWAPVLFLCLRHLQFRICWEHLSVSDCFRATAEMVVSSWLLRVQWQLCDCWITESQNHQGWKDQQDHPVQPSTRVKTALKMCRFIYPTTPWAACSNASFWERGISVFCHFSVPHSFREEMSLTWTMPGAT